MSLNGTSQASFGYDGNGARTSKTAGGVTTSYVNDTRSLTQVLQETTGANTKSYVPGVLQYDPSLSGAAQWAYFHGVIMALGPPPAMKIAPMQDPERTGRAIYIAEMG